MEGYYWLEIWSMKMCQWEEMLRFTQYLASRNTLFNLNNFLDKGALQGKIPMEL
ncbi:hypothetical protein CRENBAI_008163 [Crenichthys baileyi]|uniref:Uncharacterized protein n=1 Tax=Crenichthys baileyi TaxID=28760 RepID=A0AAV9S7P2_9TELE